MSALTRAAVKKALGRARESRLVSHILGGPHCKVRGKPYDIKSAFNKGGIDQPGELRPEVVAIC